MAATRFTTVRRRRLANELKRLRLAAGLTGEQVSDQLAELGGRWSHSKVSRIETGQVNVHHGDVADLLDLYGCDDMTVRQDLIAIARENGKKGWWHSYQDVMPEHVNPYVGFETAADSIRTVRGQLLPGLLQTEAYARAVIRSVRAESAADEVERLVELRVARQQALTRSDAPRLWVILDEAALARQVGGPDVMREQLDHLRIVAKLPNVMVQVLPISAGEHPGMDTPFTILGFPNAMDADIVYLEHLIGALYLEQDEEIRSYTRWFDHLRASALSVKDSAALIGKVAKGL